MPNYISTALYFEDRAQRTRHQAERERLLAVARKYRELAADESRHVRDTSKGPVENRRT